MFNATIVGRLGADAESRATPSGKTVTSFRVATDHGFGEKKTTTWIKVAVFGKEAEWAAGNLKKGDSVAVAGACYLEEWTGRDGAAKVTLCCDAARVEKQYAPKSGGEEPARSPSRAPRGRVEDDDGGVPF